MGLFKEIAASVIALSMLTNPSAPSRPDSPTQPIVAQAKERQLQNFDVPLNILASFVNLEDPYIAKLYEEVSRNPDKHIGIADDLGYRDYSPGIPGYMTYLIFAGARRVPNESFSMIVLASTQKDASAQDDIVGIQLNSSFHVYQGEGDTLPLFSRVPWYVLASIAYSAFNEPAEMNDGQPWPTVYDPLYNMPNYEKAFTGTDGSRYRLTVRPDNIIMFSSTNKSSIEKRILSTGR